MNREQLEDYIHTLEIVEKELPAHAHPIHRERLRQLRDRFKWQLRQLEKEGNKREYFLLERQLSLGKTIKKLRERQDLDRRELAKNLGITYHAISKYETDERKPNYVILVKMANFFNVTVDYLLR